MRENIGNEVSNNLLSWLFHEVEILQSIWLALEGLFSLGVDRVMLIIDLIELDETNLGNLLVVFMFLEVLNNLVAHLDEEALVSKSM